MAWRITCDTGGTFTDLVVADENGFRTLAKASTTPEHMAAGIETALERAADQLDLELAELLGNAERFVLATTKATNAILEGTTAKTAFVTTRGCRDLLLFKEGGRADPFDYTEPTPRPYVPRYLTFEVTERVASDGEVLIPLVESEVVEIAKRMKELEVEAIAVCFLWSIAHPEHEQRVVAILEEHCPDCAISASNVVNPIIREYRRASGTAMDASLKPLLQSHLQELDERLNELGLGCPAQMATSSGGVLPLSAVIEAPLLALDCGPAMAPLAAQAWAGADAAAAGDDLIVIDTGGTSFDVSLVRDGEIALTNERWTGPELTGHITGLAGVDVHSIGAGGGSIAWVDAGGLMRVGPRSAGADPGPACYGRGGTEPTVTDAALVLGYLDPDYFLGGAMKLEPERAEAALDELAASLEMDRREAAAGVLTIASENMVTAISETTIAQGIDPREATLVAGGGASGLFAVPVARELGVRGIIAPPMAAGFSACGAQLADVVLERALTHMTSDADFDYEGVAAAIEKVRAEVHEGLRAVDETGTTQATDHVIANVRYPLQAWELRTLLPSGAVSGEKELKQLTADFHDFHRRMFTVANEDETVELVSWLVRRVLSQQKPEMAYLPSSGVDEGRMERREVFFRDLGPVECDVLVLGAGRTVARELEGPAVIENPTTTLVLHPGSTASINEDGLIRVELEGVDQVAAFAPKTASERQSHERAQLKDPIKTAVMANRLDAIGVEMNNTLLRAARTSVINQAKDVSCAVITADNRLITAADGLPVFLVGTEDLTRSMTDLIPDIAEGDAFLHNDPYLGNTHHADFNVIVPVFWKGEHVLTVNAKAHMADCGNSKPTTYMAEAKDIFEEGAINLPCVRIERDYQELDDIIRMCTSRVRTPDAWYGDYLAMLGAARIGEKRLIEFLDKYGRDGLEEFIDEWFRYSKFMMIELIGRFNTGEYRVECAHDEIPGIFGEIPVGVTVRVDAENGHMEFDLTDNIDCIPAGLNVSETTAQTSPVVALLNSLPEKVPINRGSLSCLTLKLRRNCVAGIPEWPACCSVSTNHVSERIIGATQRALAQAGDDLGLAEGGIGMGPGVGVISGFDEVRGLHYQTQIILGVGGGPASAWVDGWEANWLNAPCGGYVQKDSIEMDEQMYPFVAWEQQLRTDGEGAGKHRGSPGTRARFSPRHREMIVHYIIDGHDNPPVGVKGGGIAARSEAFKIESDGSHTELPLIDGTSIMPDEEMLSLGSGGGGYGLAHERAPAAVLIDVRDELVSRERAEEVYGVVVDTTDSNPEKWFVDDEATEARRAVLRDTAAAPV